MIYTGYWAKIKEYEANGLTPVGISGWSPDGYTGKTYKKLAPKYAWWKEWHDNNLSEQWYITQYQNTVLNKAQEYSLKTSYEENKNKIIGHIVEFPLHFLEEEDLGISFFSKENLVPERNFT